MVVAGRWCRAYIAGPTGHPDRLYLIVTYHRGGLAPPRQYRIDGEAVTLSARQLTVSPKLMRRMLRNPEEST